MISHQTGIVLLEIRGFEEVSDPPPLRIIKTIYEIEMSTLDISKSDGFIFVVDISRNKRLDNYKNITVIFSSLFFWGGETTLTIHF